MKVKANVRNSTSTAASNIQFSDYFNIDEIQRLQDLFSDACGVASIVTHPDGTPITKPSNFCRLCNNIIRRTKKGLANCYLSDSVLGQPNSSGPIVQCCLSGELWDAGVSMTVGGQHIANWLIGQVRNEESDEQRIIQYADKIGANREEFLSALSEVPVMAAGQFTKVSEMLFAFAKELSDSAYNKAQLKLQTREHEKTKKVMQDIQWFNRRIVETTNEGIWAMDSDYNTTYINSKMAAMLGYTIEEIMARKVTDFFYPEDRQDHLDKRAQRMAGKSGFYERRFKRKNGSAIWTIVSSTPNFDDDRVFIGSFGMVIDITDRKKAEEELIERKEKYRGLSEAAFEAIFISEKGICIEQNQSAEKMFGYTSEEAVGRLGTDWIAVEDRAMVMDHMIRGYEEPYEANALKKDGTTFPCMLRGKMMHYKGRDVRVTSLSDISGLKVAEKALKASEEKYRLSEGFLKQAQSISHLGNWTWNIKSQKVMWSDEMFNIFGVDKNTNTGELGHAIEKVIHPDDLHIVTPSNAFDFTLRKQIEYRIILPDKTIRHICAEAGEPGYDENGALIFLSGIAQDITERKKAEEKLLLEKKLLSTIIENIPDQIYYKDRESRFILCNPAVAVNCGATTPEEMIGKSDFDFFPQQMAKQFSDDEQSIMNSGKSLRDHEEICTTEPSKDVRWNLTTKVPVQDTDGHVIGLIGINKDITQRKQTEKELIELNEELDARVKLRTAELEAANKELETFSYSVSHDLKAPLRHIKGFIGLFLENKSTALTEEEHGYLKNVSGSASEMTLLIDAILSFSKLNLAELNKTTINTSAMVQKVIKFFEPEMENRKITFNIEQLPDIQGDEDLIKQVWTNLISNAIKYTGQKPEAIIGIGSKIINQETTFFVKDNGAGFDMRYVDKLFGVFKRLHKSREFDGVGIGLANVNRIVKRHGGRCQAEGVQGKGATFYFSIP